MELSLQVYPPQAARKLALVLAECRIWESLNLRNMHAVVVQPQQIRIKDLQAGEENEIFAVDNHLVDCDRFRGHGGERSHVSAHI